MRNHQHCLKYTICVSGAADTGLCGLNAKEKAKELGRQIIKQGAVLINGATTGMPFYAAQGAREEDGIIVGISPASSEKDHIRRYRLPLSYLDLVIYTGFDYAGRNLLLTRASDAIIVVCGRIGTLNEFTIAFEDKKPIGILTETGGAADMIKEIVQKAHRGPGKIVYDPDPKKLVEKVMALVKKEAVYTEKLKKKNHHKIDRQRE